VYSFRDRTWPPRMKFPPMKQVRWPWFRDRVCAFSYSATKVMSGRGCGWLVRYFIVESAAAIHLWCRRQVRGFVVR